MKTIKLHTLKTLSDNQDEFILKTDEMTELHIKKQGDKTIIQFLFGNKFDVIDGVIIVHPAIQPAIRETKDQHINVKTLVNELSCECPFVDSDLEELVNTIITDAIGFANVHLTKTDAYVKETVRIVIKKAHENGVNLMYAYRNL